MASFDLGFDVAAPPEISPEDADILNDSFPQDIVFEEVVMSTSTYEAKQGLEKNLRKKDNQRPPKNVQNGVSNSFKVCLKILNRPKKFKK